MMKRIIACIALICMLLGAVAFAETSLETYGEWLTGTWDRTAGDGTTQFVYPSDNTTLTMGGNGSLYLSIRNRNQLEVFEVTFDAKHHNLMLMDKQRGRFALYSRQIPPSPVGTWTMKMYNYVYSMIFQEDGNLLITSNDEEVIMMTWEQDGNALIISYMGGQYSCPYEDGIIDFTPMGGNPDVPGSGPFAYRQK